MLYVDILFQGRSLIFIDYLLSFHIDIFIVVTALNRNLTQSTPGKFILTGGLKIFWGEAVTSGSKDPANMYSVRVNFPESFSSDSYFFIATMKLMQANNPTKWDTAVNYYERKNNCAWIGSPAHANTTFSWIAIGY